MREQTMTLKIGGKTMHDDGVTNEREKLASHIRSDSQRSFSQRDPPRRVVRRD